MGSREEPVELLQALMVTAELTQTTLSRAAAKVMVEDLAHYDHRAILAALKRCRMECRGALSLADIIARIDDGRPGPEEAWAMIPTNEDVSVVWSAEMQQAYGVAAPLIALGDHVAARLAFRETYVRLITQARAEHSPPRWSPSLGRDRAGRQAALEDAVRKGRMTQGQAARLLPAPEARASLLLVDLERNENHTEMPAHVREQMDRLLRKVRAP